ncbi:SMI1/KNR4 family protein [Streptomyces sp. 5-8]|uniref:SMI1/KNR4 family protein n=1 Tax=Streptomyces musisoli TaxID=2802280 RepID=A0ABS1PDB9_9ACTN|nr:MULTISPECIES: SMI1/KNR4 family protein [Streptomyces]MBL1110367.1 SMI1/KNR4 family protein [Streptomyces musisoli]MBY8846652.1 SMI1/KNR4 family protein [Streptomyces sp. SP2-10]
MSSNDDQIAQVEHHFGIRFPQDYRDFLGTTGSLSQFVPPADDFLVIDALDELIGNNEAGEFQKRFPGAVVIGGDGSRELLAYDFRQNPPPLVTLDVSSEDWSSAIHQATSLAALLKHFPQTGWKWDEADPSPS